MINYTIMAKCDNKNKAEQRRRECGEKWKVLKCCSWCKNDDENHCPTSIKPLYQQPCDLRDCKSFSTTSKTKQKTKLWKLRKSFPSLQNHIIVISSCFVFCVCICAFKELKRFYHSSERKAFKTIISPPRQQAKQNKERIWFRGKLSENSTRFFLFSPLPTVVSSQWNAQAETEPQAGKLLEWIC